jgi:hypothetical protein
MTHETFCCDRFHHACESGTMERLNAVSINDASGENVLYDIAFCPFCGEEFDKPKREFWLGNCYDQGLQVYNDDPRKYPPFIPYTEVIHVREVK